MNFKAHLKATHSEQLHRAQIVIKGRINSVALSSSPEEKGVNTRHTSGG